MVELIEYVRHDGSCPFADWFDALNREAGAKVTVVLDRMSIENFGDHKSVGGGVMERRIHFGPGYRLYFARDGLELVILLIGGTKSRQSKDVATAQELWAEYRTSKRG